VNELTERGHGEVIGYEVHDQDSNQVVMVTAEMQRAANETGQLLVGTAFVQAYALKRIRDNRLYLCYMDDRSRPYRSFKAFCDEQLSALGISYSSASYQIQVANRFPKLFQRQLASAMGSNGNVMALLDASTSEESSDSDSTNVEPSTSSLFSLRKMRELLKLDDEQIQALDEDEMLLRGDGTQVRMRDLMGMKHKDLIDEVKRLKGALSDREGSEALAREQLDSVNHRLEQLADEEYSAKHAMELEKRLNDLELRMTSVEEAQKAVDAAEAEADRVFAQLEGALQFDDASVRRRVQVQLSLFMQRAGGILRDMNLPQLDAREALHGGGEKD
jgi:hypothetical protein